MQIHNILIDRKNEALAQIETLQKEVAEIDRLIASTRVPVMPSAQAAQTSHEGSIPATKDDAIIDAIKAGNNTPAKISDYIRQKLGVEVNDASTRTRLSRMKAAGKIAHDAFGWKLG